ncbi:MAG: metallophosphoesterase [Sedimentibacter sp.]|nr:metallophosphoesterase [Sedimentibacter sp.]HNZ83163.1 metallophosphoesterase [Sedimentibacter sp.]
MKLLKFTSFLILASIILYSYARFIEPVLLTVKYENIYSDLLNEKNDNIKIIQFSDSHISRYFNVTNLKKAVHKINAQNPQIVVFTGDLINKFNHYDNKENIHEIWEVLSEINAPLGKYAVYGNHDYGGGAERAYRQIMTNSGFKILVNENIKIKENNINIIGLDDSIFGTFDKETIVSLLDENYYNIIISHEPDVAEYFLQYSTDLFLAGHSHGGQVNLPFIRYTPLLAQKYIRGLYGIDNYRQTKIYVNIGLGTSTIPMRLMAAPELTVITLKNK